jgi:hypothetical protein
VVEHFTDLGTCNTASGGTEQATQQGSGQTTEKRSGRTGHCAYGHSDTRTSDGAANTSEATRDGANGSAGATT